MRLKEIGWRNLYSVSHPLPFFDRHDFVPAILGT
jgi:hypothetical protein